MNKNKLILRIPFISLFCLLLTGLQAQSLRALLEEEKTLVFAHRGAVNPEIPENSMKGMKQALDSGMYMLEIDIMESQDGILYLLHDRTLDRTTFGTGNISDWSSKDLDNLGLKGTEEQLPRFADFLAEAAQNGLFLMLDVKNAPLDKVLNLVEAADMLDRILLLTFSLERAQEAFALNHRFLVSVLVKEEEEFDEYLCKSNDPYQLAVYLNKDADLMLYDRAKKLGLPIITDVMGNIDRQGMDDPTIYREFVQKRNPDIVVSDYPVILKHVLH
ncbi:glycerophosphodiester phosphodiesterase family protein [Cecembia sp.]|uniref:glycerophosphodiester phosphodiesterase family protein n=1 Tax=Cecembia sp. TaxID=1898110 RepID=UPI0025C3075F|nr:glycerophosphodiester phosphodiesterase family protein [Cecembia sp.]